MKNIYQMLIERQDTLDKARKRLLSSLKKAPPGSLRVDDRQPNPQFYHYFSQSELSSLRPKASNLSKQSKSKIYIPKKNRELAKQLAQKDYEQKLLATMEQEISAIDCMIENYALFSDPLLYLRLSQNISASRQTLITPYFISDEEYAEQWRNQPYEGKPIGPEVQQIFTNRGEQVRSRAEKIIANKLDALGIPYRYEYPLDLSGYGTVYPDFIILNVHTREEAILEHIGLTEDFLYMRNAIKKLDLYEHNGFFPGKNLFFTYECRDFAFDDRLLEEMLKDFIP